eukprot:3013563-Rhodomonas_salina.1
MYASMPLKPTRLKNEMTKSTTFSSIQHTTRAPGDAVGEPHDFVCVYGKEGVFGEHDVDAACDEHDAGYVRGADNQGEDTYSL